MGIGRASHTTLWVAAALVLASALIVRAQGLPQTIEPLPDGPVQPLPYSHRQHLELGLECLDCHVQPDPGYEMTLPATNICMSCHETMPARSEAAQQLAQFAKSTAPIPWVRIYDLPEYVYWSHASHLDAGITCTECHGPVPERDVMRRETNVASKNGCLTCHEARQTVTDCGGCHEPRQ
jgi:hypothetical protein